MKHAVTTVFLVVYFLFAQHHSLVGQDNNPSKNSPTLEQLKTAGARKSTFLNQKLPVVDTKTPKANLDSFKKTIQPILNQSCASCHGEDDQEGNIRVDTLNPDLIHGEDVNWWVEVLSVVSNGEMPPPDEVEMSPADRSKLVQWLTTEIQIASMVRRSEGGHSSFRRLTRYEYNYALQDLLGLPFDFARDLPPEASSEDGFQNSSEMLHMSVVQLETHRRIARNALRRATVSGPKPTAKYWGVSMEMASKIDRAKQEKELKELKRKFKNEPVKQEKAVKEKLKSFKTKHRRPHYVQLSTGRTAVATWSYPGAKYAFSPSDVRPEMPQSFDHVAMLTRGRNQKLIIELGDQVPDEGIMRVRVRASRTSDDENQIPSMRVDFGWRASNEGRAVIRVFDRDTPITAAPGAPEIYQWDIPLGEIYPRNSVRNVSKLGSTPSPSEYIQLVNSSISQGDIQIDYVEISTPVFDQWPTASHKKIFFESKNRNDESKYAREILSAFMTKAWRRKVTASEVDQKLKLFLAIRNSCDSMEEAVVEVLSSVLSSPNLLYIVQRNSKETLLSTEELATRLSMFLWSSVPDDELRILGSNGKLSDPKVLTAQVKRMLADPRSRRFSKHFVRQWLDLELLDFLKVDRKRHPRFDPELKLAMQNEPIEYFHELLSNNHSVIDFIHADYTMANEKLAKHYGIRGVKGNQFQLVKLDSNTRRGGLLTQAGLLSMNSDGADSHPLKRGIWLLESLLNDPPPPPPPNVPEIDLADPAIAKMTLKERIEDHRNHAACNSCHAKIDPWGIAFENFDAIGKWRTQVNGKPVDATSKLFNQQPLDGMDGLKRFLLKNRQDQFVQALAHKMSTYALGRPLTFADRSSIHGITADVRKRGDGLATMVESVINSELFRSR